MLQLFFVAIVVQLLVCVDTRMLCTNDMLVGFFQICNDFLINDDSSVTQFEKSQIQSYFLFLADKVYLFVKTKTA